MYYLYSFFSHSIPHCNFCQFDWHIAEHFRVCLLVVRGAVRAWLKSTQPPGDWSQVGILSGCLHSSRALLLDFQPQSQDLYHAFSSRSLSRPMNYFYLFILHSSSTGAFLTVIPHTQLVFETMPKETVPLITQRLVNYRCIWTGLKINMQYILCLVSMFFCFFFTYDKIDLW